VCVRAGVFVTLTMAMSTLSVITTVLVLYLHHSTGVHPVPRWLQTLAFTVLARALRIRHAATPPPPSPPPRAVLADLKSPPPPPEASQMPSSPEPEVGGGSGGGGGGDGVTKASRMRAVNNCFRCAGRLYDGVDEMLVHLRKV